MRLYPKFYIFFLGMPNEEYKAGFQTEITAIPEGELKSTGWPLVLQFLGCPTRTRLTTFMSIHYLDIYFP